MVTGATSGLGLAAAEGFARLGATVWLVARSEGRGAQARAATTERSGHRDVRVGLCDLSDLQSVRRRFAERFTAQSQPLEVLINKAGVLPSTRALSPDGIELTFRRSQAQGTAALTPTRRANSPIRRPSAGNDTESFYLL